ncbi:hypothetical protein A3J23_01825 [Candidatus Peregrinibacteria bacterium RIFCSPLOWO2_02_FULL_48_14]|nr:MAG: hypothetical protein A3J23_01825 [Candidatus Peregrinibacteria bacterium RIFCSPLOWO2_02_FULL_48_14]
MPIEEPTYPNLEKALKSPEITDLINDFVIDCDPELSRLTQEEREKVKATWRKIDAWLDRWENLKKRFRW